MPRNSKNKQCNSKKNSYFVNSYFSISFHTIRYGIGPDHEDDIELGGSVVVGVVVVVAEGVFGTPHTRDSLALIFLSVGSHIGFSSGVT